MNEYYDFGINLQGLIDLWYGKDVYDDDTSEEVVESNEDSSETKRYRSTSSVELTENLVPTRIEARQAICVTGLDRENIQYVKSTLASLSEDPIPLESFHIKQPSDVIAGSLLVPKVVVVASHIPGKLLIDDKGNMGQIDFIYDELQELGADIMLVYLGLPKTVYPAMRHMIYHPRMIDLAFPDQPILRHLANENCLVTTVGNTDFTNMQKNVMKEWLTKPVNSDHPVFQYTSGVNSFYDDTNFWSETEVYNRSWYPKNSDVSETPYKSATEEHPLADKKRKKKKSKLFKIKKKRGYQRCEQADYDQFEEDVQMDMYSQSGYTADTFSQLSV